MRHIILGGHCIQATVTLCCPTSETKSEHMTAVLFSSCRSARTCTATISCVLTVSHMRPIGAYILGHGRGATSPLLRSVSETSSRDSSPSPIRPLSSPPGGVIGGGIKSRTVSDASQDTDFTDMTASTSSDMTRSSSSSRLSPEHVVVDANGVVHKSIFGDAAFSGRRTSSGSRPASGRRRRIR